MKEASAANMHLLFLTNYLQLGQKRNIENCIHIFLSGNQMFDTDTKTSCDASYPHGHSARLTTQGNVFEQRGVTELILYK